MHRCLLVLPLLVLVQALHALEEGIAQKEAMGMWGKRMDIVVMDISPALETKKKTFRRLREAHI